ncbi:hypothetical protein GCM10010434_093890 [Winogradskya humida]
MTRIAVCRHGRKNIPCDPPRVATSLNRGPQSVSEADLDADLAALGFGSDTGDDGPAPPEHGFTRP